MEPRHAKQLTGVAHRLLDLYGTAVRRSPSGSNSNELKSEASVQFATWSHLKVARSVSSRAAVARNRCVRHRDVLPANDQLTLVWQVGETPELQHLLTLLQERVAVELRTQSALLRLMGMIEPIVASAS